MRICSPIAVVALITALAQTAHANSFVAEIGAASLDNQGGGEIALGYRFSAARFHVTPSVGGFFYQGENDRYREETFANGNTICRDMQNGQFADDANCNNLEADWYGKIDASYGANWGEFGVGMRLSEIDNAPYGKLGLYFGERSAVQFYGGEEYFGVGLQFGGAPAASQSQAEQSELRLSGALQFDVIAVLRLKGGVKAPARRVSFAAA